IVHKAGLRQLELPVRMRARTSGISSINSWKSIYYAFKVSLAMITSALKDINLQKQSPYINGTVQGANSSHTAYQNGHYANGSGTNDVNVPATVHSSVAPKGAEIVQPS